MNLKRLFSFLSPPSEKGPVVRVEGSLSGDALEVGEAGLQRMSQAVEALSARRGYRYDLALSAGRFSLMLEDPFLSMDRFDPTPEEALVQDLQNILDCLPPEKRNRVESTFRALWRDGGEVKALALLVVPPGRIEARTRIRPEEAYDRMAEKQDEAGALPGPKGRSPLRTRIALAFLVIAASAVLIYTTSPFSRLSALEEAGQSIDLDGLEPLIGIRDFEAELEGLRFSIFPKPGFLKRSRNLGATPLVKALLEGGLYLEILDADEALLDRVPLNLDGFDGTAAIQVRTRALQLSAPPARMRLRP